MLPILHSHPKPAPRESISSYLIRLANDNGYTSLKAFLQHIFYTRKKITSVFYKPVRWDFMPPYKIKNLKLMTGHTDDDLRGSTFSYLTDVFLGQCDYVSSYKWLKPYLKNNFSYCPLCVQQYKYYSLVWRFKANPGCAEHGIKLVDRCYVCHALLPLPLCCDNAQIGSCPFCDADLTRAPAASLNYRSYAEAQDFEERMILLLSPHEDRRWQPEPEHERSSSYTTSSNTMRINWDVDLPEYRDFISFKSRYQEKWGIRLIPRLKKAVEDLFTLYWLGSHLNSAMLLYSKFQDDPDGLEDELNSKYPYLFGAKYFCMDRSPMNNNLPSKFDLLPIDPPTQELKGLLFQIKVFANKLQMDLFYKPDMVKDVSEELFSEILRWETRIKEIKDLVHSHIDED